jgi:hypothetical protein
MGSRATISGLKARTTRVSAGRGRVKAADRDDDPIKTGDKTLPFSRASSILFFRTEVGPARFLDAREPIRTVKKRGHDFLIESAVTH